MGMRKYNLLFCILERFNNNIQHQFFEEKITFVKSQHLIKIQNDILFQKPLIHKCVSHMYSDLVWRDQVIRIQG